MSYILLAAVLVSLFGLRYNSSGFNTDYIDREQTRNINGVFVILIFMSHFAQYITLDKNSVYYDVKSQLSQLVVVTFLFYSGYGIMCSIMRKGQRYVRQMPLRRLLPVWAHFALALLLFMISNLILGYKYSLKDTLLSFVGWSSIGNSNWYIFCILALYVFTIVSFLIFRSSHTRALLCMFLLTGAYIAVMSRYKEVHWYNTAIMYPFGMLYACKKKEIESAVMNSGASYWKAFINAALLLIAFSYIWPASKWMLMPFECKAVCFMAFTVLLTMKFKIGNRVLHFFGNYTFEVYILQRIPMRLLVHRIDNLYLFFAASFAATIAMSVVFKLFTGLLDKGWNKLLDKALPQPSK
ncbi:MAG: hypothetical protein IKP47_07225 [Ruminococcus sp.]|nr:hypothetical protein [Ruminococcus sp.]